MSKPVPTLPLPSFYNAGQNTDPEYFPNADELLKVAESWAKTHGLKPVGDRSLKNVQLLVIDDQFDFSFPTGSLYVGGRSGTGATDAHQNLVEFIYRYLGIISGITCTLDSHILYQVFYAAAHLKKDGGHPDPHTIITADEYKAGDYLPNPAFATQIGASVPWLTKQFIHYCEQLAAKNKPPLYLWPNHCNLGTKGHRLAGVVEAARLFHGYARGAANSPEIKGGNPLTEHYSIFQPEVTTLWTGAPIPGVQKNAKLLEKLQTSDAVIIAGLASSHCVKESIADFLREIMNKDQELAKKVYILRDCTAAVVVPGVIDFTDIAEAALQEFASAGMNVVDSTTPIEDWPGINLN